MVKHQIADGTVKQYVATFAGHIIAQDSIFTRKRDKITEDLDIVTQIENGYNPDLIESCDGRDHRIYLAR